MKHSDAIYSREETSPDGSLHICYNYADGEKTPTLIQPCVTVVANGEVLLDLWCGILNGHIDDFNDHGFRLTVTDGYAMKAILVRVEVKSRTFILPDDPTRPKSLTTLDETLIGIALRAREERAAASSSAPSHPSIISRLNHWVEGGA